MIPGGYKLVSVPMFKNYSMEPGIEVYYTSALRREFERSRVAAVTDSNNAEVELIGEIMSITYVPQSPQTGGTYPTGTVLAGSYDIRALVKLTLKRKSDGKELWASSFSSTRNYGAPDVTMAGINTVDPLYGQSARRITIQTLSQTMMAEAHDRLSESF
jgi:hypothetical protein